MGTWTQEHDEQEKRGYHGGHRPVRMNIFYDEGVVLCDVGCCVCPVEGMTLAGPCLAFAPFFLNFNKYTEYPRAGEIYRNCRPTDVTKDGNS